MLLDLPNEIIENIIKCLPRRDAENLSVVNEKFREQYDYLLLRGQFGFDTKVFDVEAKGNFSGFVQQKYLLFIYDPTYYRDFEEDEKLTITLINTEDWSKVILEYPPYSYCSFSPNNDYYTISDNKSCSLFTLIPNKLIAKFDGEFFDIVIVSDSKLFLRSGHNIKIINPRSGNILKSIDGYMLSANDNLVALIDNGHLKIINLDNDDQDEIDVSHVHNNDIKISKNFNYISYKSGKVYLWDRKKSQVTVTNYDELEFVDEKCMVGTIYMDQGNSYSIDIKIILDFDLKMIDLPISDAFSYNDDYLFLRHCCMLYIVNLEDFTYKNIKFDKEVGVINSGKKFITVELYESCYGSSDLAVVNLFRNKVVERMQVKHGYISRDDKLLYCNS